MDSELLSMPTEQLLRETLSGVRRLEEQIGGPNGMREQVTRLSVQVESSSKASATWQDAHEKRDEERFQRLDDREDERALERRAELERQDRHEQRAWSFREKVALGLLALATAAVTGGVVGGGAGVAAATTAPAAIEAQP